MTETPNENPEQEDGNANQQQAGESKTFTQADLDRIVQERLAKERKKYEGFDQYKQQADELGKIKEAEKSEVERLQEQLQTNADQLSSSQLELSRWKALAAHPVSGEYQDLVQGTDDDTFLASAKRISELEARGNTDDGRRKPNPVEGIEKTIPSTDPSLDEQIMQAQNDGNWVLAGQLKAQKLGSP